MNENLQNASLSQSSEGPRSLVDEMLNRPELMRNPSRLKDLEKLLNTEEFGGGVQRNQPIVDILRQLIQTEQSGQDHEGINLVRPRRTPSMRNMGTGHEEEYNEPRKMNRMQELMQLAGDVVKFPITKEELLENVYRGMNNEAMKNKYGYPKGRVLPINPANPKANSPNRKTELEDLLVGVA